MPDAERQLDLTDPTAKDGKLIPAEPLHLQVTFDLAAGEIVFEWARDGGSDPQIVARGRLVPSEISFAGYVLNWFLEFDGKPRNGLCSAWPASVRAMLNRIRKTFPLADELPCIGLLTDTNLGPARAGEFFPLLTPPGENFWKRLGRDVLEFARVLESRLSVSGDPATRESAALRLLACARMGGPTELRRSAGQGRFPRAGVRAVAFARDVRSGQGIR